jgi:hypothetical protein
VSTTTPKAAPDEPAAEAEIRDVLQRAGRGDETVLPALRRFLDEQPELWRQVSDLARHAERALIRLLGEDDLLAAESIERRLAELKGRLAGPAASPLERLLCDRVALTWLALHLAELDAAACRRNRDADGPRTREVQRRLDLTHRHHVAAVRQLATLRRLLRPAVSPVDLALRPLAEGNPGAGKPPGRSRLSPAAAAVAN